MSDTPRDYASISPSAKALLLVKAQTSLPFARGAAEILWGRDAVEGAAREAEGNEGALARRRHFERRARSIDEALDAMGATRVLEIAAGLSFRGLARAAASRDAFYVDTDLAAIVALKKDLAAQLHPAPLAGTLKVEALDALDADAFRRAVGAMPAGPIAIVHEGLLMYLGDEEKARLASSVRAALAEHGGWWVTADVYVRSDVPVYREEKTKRFIEAHRVEENKFADLDAAASYFARNGFRVARRIGTEKDAWTKRETWVMEAAS